MVESGGLENRCGRKSTEGSNPSVSAIFFGEVRELVESAGLENR